MTADALDALVDRIGIITGCVNLRPFLGKAPGTLLVHKVYITNSGVGEPTVKVILTHSTIGWNDCLGPDGRWYPMTDAKGESPFPPAVFPAGWEYEIVERAK